MSAGEEILARLAARRRIGHRLVVVAADHDAAAFAVHAACRLMAEPPAILEMALYHRREGRLVSGEFLPSTAQESRTVIELNEEEIRRKQRMIDCFTTQRWLLMQLDTTI